MRRSLVILSATLALCVLATGCPKKKPVPTEPTVPAAAPAPTPPPPPPPPKEVQEPAPFKEPEPERRDISSDELARQLGTVYFGFDSSDLDDAARSTLKQNADVIRQNPGPKVVVQGHCDERGSIEYNLALGQRRGDAVRAYLVSLGIDAARLQVTSYGEERPADAGHGETSWSKNRRAEFGRS